jgi:hypothetical protein
MRWQRRRGTGRLFGPQLASSRHDGRLSLQRKAIPRHSMSVSRSVIGCGASNPCRPRNEQEMTAPRSHPCRTPDRGASHRTSTLYPVTRQQLEKTVALARTMPLPSLPYSCTYERSALSARDPEVGFRRTDAHWPRDD